jgi:hypothetical protein
MKRIQLIVNDVDYAMLESIRKRNYLYKDLSRLFSEEIRKEYERQTNSR